MLTVMRPHRYDLHGSKILFPCYMQPKLNGVRCIARKTKEGICLLSRNDKPFSALQNHTRLIDELNKCMSLGEELDGELYVHGWSFQKIVSAVKKQSWLTNQLIFNVFDKIKPGPFKSRIDFTFDLTFVTKVPTTLCVDESSAYKKLDELVEQGYEGLILRNSEAEYENGQSYNVQKLKKFIDSEFKIIGGTACSKGGVIFTCATESGETFSVKPMGTLAERKRMLADIDNLVGKLLTVRYLCLSDSGIPMILTGVAIRDYE